ATVTSATGVVPTSSDGTVTFYDGATALGTVTLSGNTATLPIALPAGPHTITARYNGDGNFVGSSSGVEPTSTQLVAQSELAGFPRVALDNQGDEFLAIGFQVVELKVDGSFMAVGSDLAPIGVAVDGQGDVFIDDAFTNLVWEVVAGVPVTVSPAAPASITVTPCNVPYDGNVHTATGTATGALGEDLSADLNLTGTAHTNAIIYIETWTFHDPSGNYQDASGIVTDTISPASANPSVTGYSVPFDGNAHTAVASATDINGNPLPASDFALTATVHTNAGTSTDAW